MVANNGYSVKHDVSRNRVAEISYLRRVYRSHSKKYRIRNDQIREEL